MEAYWLIGEQIHLGSDIDYNFFIKPYSIRVSGCRAGGLKLGAFFKKPKIDTKTQISSSLSNLLCPIRQ